MEDVFTTKSRLSLIKSYLSVSVGYANDLMNNTGQLYDTNMQRKCGNGGAFSDLMTHFFKAFDCLHLDGYGLDLK